MHRSLEGDGDDLARQHFVDASCDFRPLPRLPDTASLRKFCTCTIFMVYALHFESFMSTDEFLVFSEVTHMFERSIESDLLLIRQQRSAPVVLSSWLAMIFSARRDGFWFGSSCNEVIWEGGSSQKTLFDQWERQMLRQLWIDEGGQENDATTSNILKKSRPFTEGATIANGVWYLHLGRRWIV